MVLRFSPDENDDGDALDELEEHAVVQRVC